MSKGLSGFKNFCFGVVNPVIDPSPGEAKTGGDGGSRTRV